MRQIFSLFFLLLCHPVLADGKLELKLSEIAGVKEGLIQLSHGEGNPLLIVHGIDFSVYPQEWVEPFENLIQNQNHSYLHKWSSRKGLKENRDSLIQSIRQLLKEYPQQRLTIFGFSAGGAISLMALDKLSGSRDMEKIFLHTIASPFYGFEAPKQAYLGAPFAGKGRIEMGIGAYGLMKTKSFPNCHHWVTTNCSLDKNACNKKKLNPQTGPFEGKAQMPCGDSEVTRIDNETHTSVILPVLHEVVGK